MTIDVNVHRLDDDFLDEIEDIMEETMVQMFILHPHDSDALAEAKTHAASHNAIFYSVPAELLDEADENCIGCSLRQPSASDVLPLPKHPLFVEEQLIDDVLRSQLIQSGSHGIILNATRPHEDLARFHLAIGPGSIEKFDREELGGLSMDRILLHSGYPDFGFEQIYETAKRISDIMFRPEQSIIARATKSSLELFGFRKH